MSLPIEQNVAQALAEDIGNGDLTAALIPEDAQTTARLIVRELAILCGRPWAEEVCKQVDPELQIIWHFDEGDMIGTDDIVCEISGKARSILTAERTAINFLQTLSGVATTTAQYVRAVAGTGCQILDTRKTIPGLRLAQKYAVKVGGGMNHRIGLYDGVLIKENHIAAAGSITAALSSAKQAAPDCELIEVEVESLNELNEALNAGATRIMLDNFDLDMKRQAVELNAKRAKLEASGDITMEGIKAIAETGVDYISIGALTKHVKAVDFSLRLQGA